MAQGIADFVDTTTPDRARETGGKAVFRGKTIEMGREAWKVEAVDLIHGVTRIRATNPAISRFTSECQARLTTTGGAHHLVDDAGPRPTAASKALQEQVGPGTGKEILMTIWDAAVSKRGHIPETRISRASSPATA